MMRLRSFDAVSRSTGWLEKSVESSVARLAFFRHLITLSALRQHVRQNRKADLLSGLQIDHKLKFCELFADREVAVNEHRIYFGKKVGATGWSPLQK